MKKINAMLHNPKVQGNLLLTAIFLAVVVVVVLTSGK
jgi:hypothetical protein